MKANLSRMLRSGVAMLLVVCMVAGFIPAAAFATEVKDGNADGIINYVSFGASNVNGYGLRGYLGEGVTAEDKDTQNVYGYQRMPVGSYPYLIAEALNEKAGGTSAAGYKGDLKAMQPFSKVHVDQLAMSSMRMEELRFLLDDTYPGDSYTDWRFYELGLDDRMSQNWFALAEEDLTTLRGKYEEAITNADVITLDMGINNFGVYISHQVGDKYGETLEDIDPELAAEFDKAKEYVKGIVAQYTPDLAPTLAEMEGMIDSLAYTLVGFCTSFDVVMEKIQQLNPGATVVVVSIQNLLTGLSVELDAVEQALPLDSIFGAVINAANLYTASGSPYTGSYLYADVRKDGRVEFFIDDLKNYNGDPATLTGNHIDCYTVYDDDLDLYKNIPAVVQSIQANEIKNGLSAYLGILRNIYGTTGEVALLGAYLADGEAGFATAEAKLTEAVVETQIDEATAVACLNAMKQVFDDYKDNTPVYTKRVSVMAYDVITELFQEAVKDDVINFSALSSDNKGAVEGALLDAILSTAEDAIKKGIVDENYTFTLKNEYPNGFFETKAAEAGLDAALVKSIACMGIRTGIGNSFYGHPTPNGHAQIADVILETLEEDVTGEDVVVEEVKIALDELYKLVETYGPEVAEQVWQQWEEYGYVDMVNTSVAELKDQLEERYAYYTETALPAINESVNALSAQKDALTAELGELKTELAAKQAELAEVIANAEIGSVHTPDISIDVELGNNEQTQVPENDCTVNSEGIRAELEAAVKDLEHAIATIEALIADIEADVADLVALAEQIAAAAAELEKTLSDLAAAADDVAQAVEAVVNVVKNSDGVVDAAMESFKAARATAEAALDVLNITMGYAAELETDLNGMIEKIAADAEALYNKFITEVPDCIEQIPEEAKMLIGGSVLLAQQAYEANKAEIEQTLTAELNKLAEEYASNEAAVKQQLTELEAKIAAEIESKYAEAEADIAAQIESAKAEAAAKLAALEEELKGYQAELEALAEDAAEDVRQGIQAQIDRVNGDMATVNADLEHAVAHLEKAAEEAYEIIKAEVTKAYEEAVAELNAKLAELKAAYDKAVEDLKAAADKAIADLTAELNKQLEELGKIGEALAAEINGILNAIREELLGVQKAVEEILKGNLAAIEDLKNILIAMGCESIVEAVEELVNIVVKLIKEANTADLEITDTFKYVAIGDGSAETESYVESLTAALNAEAAANGVDEIEVVNYAKAGNTVAEERAALSDVTDADLITVGFSNVEFLAEAVDTAFNGGEFDWAAAVGAENVQYVDQLLAEVAAKIAEAGIQGETAEMANDAIEAYAYSVVQYVVELPELINEIHAANEDALIIIVGMYNPMNGVTIDLGNNVTLEMDEYMDYLVMGAGVHGVAYSMLSGNSIYVDAPAVQTENIKTVYGIRDLLGLVTSDYAALYPSAAGDAYITSKIAEALDISYLSNPFIDVFPEDWYFDAVLWAYKNGITKGYGKPNTFCPNQDCTRAEIVTFLWRANGCPAPSSDVNPFVDISKETGDWYYDAVLWACEQGITEGYGDNEHFAPNVTCDRAQVATFLHRAEGKPAVNNGANPFIDIKAGTWYTEAVLWAAENDITVGYGEANTFRPELTCTRAQIVTFLYRAYK